MSYVIDIDIRNKEKRFCVYSLNDPDTGLVRYIGITGRPLKERFQEHFKANTKTKKSSWIKSLKFNHKRPSIELIEGGLSEMECKEKEIQYIKIFKSFGARLVNGTDGGDGILNASKEVREKIGNAHRGKKLSSEQIEFIRKINTGRKAPQQTKDAVKKAHTGKVVSEETRAKISLANTGKSYMRQETRLRFSKERKGKKISEERRLKMIGRTPTKENLEKRSASMKKYIASLSKEEKAKKFKGRIKFNEDAVSGMKKLYSEGISISEISRRYSAQWNTVKRLVR
jgi:hypothetical protein